MRRCANEEEIVVDFGHPEMNDSRVQWVKRRDIGQVPMRCIAPVGELAPVGNDVGRRSTSIWQTESG